MGFWDRFYRKVVMGESGCHLWVGARRSGYGVLRKGRQLVSAHRVAYGPVPVGLEIDHVCGNRNCVNREHLRAVTASMRSARTWREQKYGAAS